MNAPMQKHVQTNSAPKPAFSVAPTSLLQHKCACGGTPGLDGECAQCRTTRLQHQCADQAERADVSPIVHGVLHSPARPHGSASGSFLEPRFGHDFSRAEVFPALPERPMVSSRWDVADSAELPLPGEDVEPGVDLADGGTPMTAPPAPVDVAEQRSCCKLRSFTASDDTYVDTDTDTRKNIKFTCGVEPGSDPRKCVMVNWIQGTAKNKDGTFRQVQMFDKTVDYNFPAMRIDSLDKDPVYWSNSSGRWNYRLTVGTGDEFFATDSPGPQVWVDGIDYDLKFKMCAHCIDDVSATSDESGSGVKNPLKSIDWVFKAKYDAATKKFTH
jgi:hypothetical protein